MSHQSGILHSLIFVVIVDKCQTNYVVKAEEDANDNENAENGNLSSVCSN